jgi:hypothetical protein
MSANTTNYEAPGPLQTQPVNRVDQPLPPFIAKSRFSARPVTGDCLDIVCNLECASDAAKPLNLLSKHYRHMLFRARVEYCVDHILGT